MFTPRAVIFDLDGTLVDSVPDLGASVDALMAELGRPAPGIATVKNWVGNGVEKLVERALTGELDGRTNPRELTRCVARFLEIYRENNGKHSTLYPTVAHTLQHLSDAELALAVVTNKPAAFTVPLLHSLGVAHFFSVLVSGDTLEQKKPHPAPVRFALRELHVNVADALFVGDSIHDVTAGKAAGVPVVCVSYGYNHGADIRTARPDAVIDSLAELQALIATRA